MNVKSIFHTQYNIYLNYDRTIAMNQIPGFFSKCCGKSKKKNVITDVPVEDFGATNNTNNKSQAFLGCSSCEEVSKLGLHMQKGFARNSNRISELQHQNTTLTKELQVIKRLLENK